MPGKERFQIPRPKQGKLYAQYGRMGRGYAPSVVYVFDGRDAKPDSRVLMKALEEVPVFEGRSLCQELELRGYDITTLRFSIDRHAGPVAEEVRTGSREAPSGD